MLVGVSVILFPAYVYMRKSNIPAYANTCTNANFIDATLPVTTAEAVCVRGEGTLQVTVDFPVFAVAVMNFLGWIILMLFLPLGQWALFFDNFFAFVHRPKPMKEDQFNKAK